MKPALRPRLGKPWCRRPQGLDDLSLSLFASGLSMRRILDQIAAHYSADASTGLIYKINDEVHQETRGPRGEVEIALRERPAHDDVGRLADEDGQR